MGKVVGNSTTVTYGTGGTPLVTSSANLGTPHTYGGVGIDTAGPAVKGNVTVPLGDTGKSVQTVAKSAIPRAGIARGLIKLAKFGAGGVGGYVAGVAAEALLDYGLKNIKLGADGSLQGEADDPDAKYDVSDGYYWSASPYIAPSQGPTAACRAWWDASYQYLNMTVQSQTVVDTGPGAKQCVYEGLAYGWRPETVRFNITRGGNTSCIPGMFIVDDKCTDKKPYKVMTEQELFNAIASQSGWPTSSAKALQHMLGEPSIRTDLDPQPAGIVGPMTIPGATSKSSESVKLVPGTNVEAPPGATQTDPGTKTTTSTKTHPITYSGPEVKYGTVTNNVTNITNNVTNVTTTETTKTEEAEDDNKGDQCEKYPDSIACQKVELDTPDDEIPRSKATVTYSIEDSWGGGSCPADVYTNVGGQSIKAYDWQQTCGYVATYVRPILYLLCAFGALWIVMPGKADS